VNALAYFTGMGAAALAAGVPAVRRAVAGDVERDWLQGELDLDRIDPDGATVHLKSGGAFRVFRLTGQPYETKPAAAQEELLLGRQAWLNELGEKGIAVRLYGVKRLRDASAPGRWPSPTLEEVAAAEAALHRRSYRIDWYVAIATEGPLRPLLEATARTAAVLAGYRPELLVRAEDGGCPFTGFLNGLVSGDYRDDLPAVSADVSWNLPASDLAFGRDGAVSACQPVPAHYRLAAIRAWPEVVSGELAAGVMALPGELELSHVARPLPRERTVALLARKKNELRANIFASDTALEEHTAAMNLLAEGRFLLFQTQCQVVLRAPTPAELDALTERLTALLAVWRVVASVETAGAPVAWFNRVPGPGRLIRPLRLMNRDLAALWSFHHAPTGQPASPWGEAPVRLFRAGSGQSYAFQFHVSERPESNGHYLVFAPTGAGKTTLMMHLLGGLAKFAGVRAFVFDSKEGARFTVEALGGLYQSFDSLRLNPLDVGPDTLAARQRVAGVMKSMLGPLGASEEADRAVAHALHLVFHLEPPERTFNAIFPAAFEHRSEVQRAFAKWVVDAKGKTGHYAHVFNAPHDSLARDFAGAWLVGINMNELLSDDLLGPPAVAHIAAAAVIENAATLIFFPNALATEASYAPFHLNAEQLDFVLHGAAGGGRRVLLVKRDLATGYDESAILDIDLAPLGAVTRLYRSGPEAVAHLLRLQRNHGGEWLSHV